MNEPFGSDWGCTPPPPKQFKCCYIARYYEKIARAPGAAGVGGMGETRTAKITD